MKKTNESALVRQCLDYLAAKGIMAWRTNNTAVYDPRSKRYRAFAGLKGVSDILGIMPPDGKMLAVECKVRPNKPSADQKRFIESILEAGGFAMVVYDVSELIEFMDLHWRI